jgi:hypothetical protein
MKRLVLLAALVAVAFMPTVAQADSVFAGDIIQVQPGPPGSRYGNGGQFTLYDMTGAGSGTSFVTFCIETNEFLNFGVNLKVLSVTTNAIAGGTGGSSPDPLDTRSAFIYKKYRDGNPYGWTGREVQQAIWWIEEERTSVGAPTPPAWVTNGTLAGYISSTGWTGLGNVRVLNIAYPASGSTGQDLLTLPDGGATLTLLGCALLGLGALRRKLRG